MNKCWKCGLNYAENMVSATSGLCVKCDGEPVVNWGGPAFPDPGHHPGMSVRVWLTGQALAGFCANPEMHATSITDVARFAVKQADAAIKELGL